jgi:hypothetical protein
MFLDAWVYVACGKSLENLKKKTEKESLYSLHPVAYD